MVWTRRHTMRVAVALVIGVACHAAWVVLFILGASLGASAIVRGALWLAAPIVTAAGYAAGLAIRVRGTSPLAWRFPHLFVAVAIGCTAGEIVGSRVGPMFAGLGVVGAGALSALGLAIGDAARRRI